MFQVVDITHDGPFANRANIGAMSTTDICHCAILLANIDLGRRYARQQGTASDDEENMHSAKSSQIIIKN